jgi:hypothetical protein
VSSQELLTNKNQVLARWKEHFEEHLNECFESEQPTRPVDLRDDGVDIDLPSREEIEGALKELQSKHSLYESFVIPEYMSKFRKTSFLMLFPSGRKNSCNKKSY